jgi:hypothetical protein
VTGPDSSDFVGERDRVAVFDNYGTPWTEQHVNAQLLAGGLASPVTGDAGARARANAEPVLDYGGLSTAQPFFA